MEYLFRSQMGEQRSLPKFILDVSEGEEWGFENGNKESFLEKNCLEGHEKPLESFKEGKVHCFVLEFLCFL